VTTARREPPHHDTLTCYCDYQCRLPECVQRYRAWENKRYHAKAAGTWQPLLDAEPVRQHLLQLHAAGITIHRVAAITGLTYRAVRNFTQHDYGHTASRKRRVTPEVAAKILAVNTRDHTPGNVDSTGSRRRIQALVAIGWPSIYVADRAGIHRSNRSVIVNRPTVRATTAQRITAAYDEMRHQKPARHGISKTSIKRAKQQAAANRWPTPSYWDECGAIDDPHFEPQYGVSRRELVAQDANWIMRTTGLDRATTAQRLGVHKSYLDHAFRDHPEYALDVAA
jgi:AraC-like DNA-binding protein